MTITTYTNKINIAVIGTGDVGKTLSAAFANEGNPTMIGTRDVTKADVVAFKQSNPNILIGTMEEAARFGDIVVLAVGGTVAIEVITKIASEIKDKIVIDAVNPIKQAPLNKGALIYFTEQNHSLMEELIKVAPEAHFVKAFNTVGNKLMYKPEFPNGERPTMFICGDSADAKKAIQPLLEAFGHDVSDVGASTLATFVEAVCPIWCAIAFQSGVFNGHAFKLLKK